MNTDVEGFEAVQVAGGIQQAINGLGVGASRFRQAYHGAVGLGHDAGGVRRIIKQARSLALKPRVKFTSEPVAVRRSASDVFPFRQLFERCGSESLKELRVELAHLRDHLPDDGACFAWRVRSRTHPP